jgi:hypothetical protein
VDLDKSKIEVKHTKSGDNRAIPINSFLWNLLSSMGKDSTLVFTNINPQWREMVEAVETLAKVCHVFVTQKAK